MGLFSSIIFVEKMWSRGLLVSRVAGIVLITLGFVAITFAPKFHYLLGVGGDMGAEHDSNPLDMKGTMDMEGTMKMTTESAAVHKPYNSKTTLAT